MTRSNAITVVEQDTLWRRFAAALHVGEWNRDDKGRIRRGAWMMGYTGSKVWPLDPRADEITFDDLCVGLARECRYGNHSREFFSVGEHSVIVSIFVEQLALERGWSLGAAHEAACEALLHDVAEAFLGDIPRPLKRQREMRWYEGVEAKWMRAVHARFGVRPTPASTALVDEVDNRILTDEVHALMLDPGVFTRLREPLGCDIEALPWERAAALFALRFVELFPEWVAREFDGVDYLVPVRDRLTGVCA